MIDNNLYIYTSHFLSCHIAKKHKLGLCIFDSELLLFRIFLALGKAFLLSPLPMGVKPKWLISDFYKTSGSWIAAEDDMG